MSTNGTRHFLDLIDIPPQELRSMIDASRAMKARRGSTRGALEGKTLAMIFDKPSTRTRVSFDVAMRQLRGEAAGRQVEGARLACVNGTGGWFSSASTAILGVD